MQQSSGDDISTAGPSGQTQQHPQQQMNMNALSPDASYLGGDFKMDFNVLSPNAAPSPGNMLSQQQQQQSGDYQMYETMTKAFIKEEPVDINSCTQLSPLSPTSSGLGSSLHSQSPQTTNYFTTIAGSANISALQQQQQQQMSNLYTNTRVGGGDPILASASIIKNEAFSPKSMDICN